MVDSRLTRRVDADGQVWQICQECIEWTRYEDLAIDPDDGQRWDVCKTCRPAEAEFELPCWDDETDTGHPTHDLDSGHHCNRCGYQANWCTAKGEWWWNPSWGYDYDDCGQLAEFCARPAEGPACLPVCGECKTEIEASTTLKQKYDVVVFEPYDALTSGRSCTNHFCHDEWDGWTLEPPVPAELEPSFTERLIDELKAIRADLKNCARDTEGLMYERGPDGLRLRAFVAAADTNGPPDDADARIWAARGRIGALLDLLEPSPQEGT